MAKVNVKKVLGIVARTLLIVLMVVLTGSLFVWNNGIQYSLGLLTGSIRDPYFDEAQYTAEQNCYGADLCESGLIRVLTYNILCRICVKEEYDPWDVRVQHLRNLVERYDPDLIGSQELGGWKDISEYLPANDVYTPVTFEFGPRTYADAALFYRQSKYELLDSGQFWLSPTPHLPFGFAWKPLSAPRYVTWAYLRDRQNGFSFLFVNTHMDNNPENKDTCAPIVFETFSTYAKHMPMIFTGDFNTNPTHDRYDVLQRGQGDEIVFVNAADLAPTRELVTYAADIDGPTGTTLLDTLDHTIDHIFLAGPANMDVSRWMVDHNRYGKAQRPASDHPAVYSELQFVLRP